MVFPYARRKLIAVVLALGLAGCGSGDGQGGTSGRGGPRARSRGDAAAVPVKVEPVARQDIADYVLANTTLEADKWVDVRSRASGQVMEVLSEEGDRAEVAGVLARLDSEAARLQVAQMEVAYQDALRTFEREDKMFGLKLVSKERFENAKAQLDRTKAQYDQARLDLSYTTISSPISGVVTSRRVEIGNMVTTNQILFSVADFEPLLARIRIPEKEIGKIVVGQTARITAESLSGKTFDGRVKMISPVVNPESGTIKVTIEIPGRGNTNIRPGMFISVYIITEIHDRALVIPKKALVLEGEGNQVFVYEVVSETGTGRALRKRIQTGLKDNERLEVVSGLSEGDFVITVGQDGLRPGTAVRLVGEGASQLASAAETDAPGPGGAGVGSAAPGSRMGSDQFKQMRQRIFERFPKVKEAYRKQLESDPELATDSQKWQAFMKTMREKGLLPTFGGMGQGGRRR